MSFREALPGEAAEIASFLRKHIDRAMFPLANLTDHGMGRAGRYQMRFWIRSAADGIGAALGLSAMGMLLPVLPGVASAELRFLRATLAGETLRGIIGAPDWAGTLSNALGVRSDDVQHIDDEPGFALDLGELVLPPDPSLTLCTPDRAHRPLLIRWRAAYLGEVMGTPPDRREAVATEDIETYLARGSHRLLIRQGAPVAFTGFNAILPEAVQVGGVYTPPELRGRGYARAAVALHLAEARDAGIPRAILFAANEAAARAYSAIGFRPGGHMRMMLFREGTRIAA